MRNDSGKIRVVVVGVSKRWIDFGSRVGRIGSWLDFRGLRVIFKNLVSRIRMLELILVELGKIVGVRGLFGGGVYMERELRIYFETC